MGKKILKIILGCMLYPILVLAVIVIAGMIAIGVIAPEITIGFILILTIIAIPGVIIGYLLK